MVEADIQARATEIGGLIRDRLIANESDLTGQWRSSGSVATFVLDDLLPDEIARQIHDHAPGPDSLMLKSSLRERKRVGVSIDQWNPAIGGALLAMQRPEVIETVERICGIPGLQADPTLYAAGISIMKKGDFLQPHLDNSHDGDQKLYRALNLLLYLTPDWTEENGGSLELWDPSVHYREPIPAKFNRLVVMRTDQQSWHSVDRIRIDRDRLCLSTYLFSPESPTGRDYRHVTFFLGRPEQPLQRILLRLDGHLRSVLGAMFPQLLLRNPHRIRKEEK